MFVRVFFIIFNLNISFHLGSQDTLHCDEYVIHKTFDNSGVKYESIEKEYFYKFYEDNLIFKIGNRYAYSINVKFKNEPRYITLDGLFEEKPDSVYTYMLYSVDTIFNPNYMNYHDQSPYFLRFFDENLSNLGYEYTGCIENSQNFWLHPLNTRLFRSTYRLPWPFYVFDKKTIGDVYFWNHGIPNFYSFKEIAPYEGVKILNFKYQVKDVYYKLHNNQMIKIYKIYATNTAEESSEFSEFEFNCTYGFLSMKFYFDTGFEFLFNQLETKDIPLRIFTKYYLNK